MMIRLNAVKSVSCINVHGEVDRVLRHEARGLVGRDPSSASSPLTTSTTAAQPSSPAAARSLTEEPAAVLTCSLDGHHLSAASAISRRGRPATAPALLVGTSPPFPLEHSPSGSLIEDIAIASLDTMKRRTVAGPGNSARLIMASSVCGHREPQQDTVLQPSRPFEGETHLVGLVVVSARPVPLAPPPELTEPSPGLAAEFRPLRVSVRQTALCLFLLRFFVYIAERFAAQQFVLEDRLPSAQPVDNLAASSLTLQTKHACCWTLDFPRHRACVVSSSPPACQRPKLYFRP
ncbi:hypothetical protein C8034_v000471 [Colletotrichum sidae]|uniref:Uncharacterized protein n=1 Tax=Colletotrichum sidae TaxID=1347389 RepID=A0A4R8TGT6_9PEZI|nr:hypothetical protein C8034_v000471 [Colletotrichum sidae]